MYININRKDLAIMPDSSRVLARYFNNGETRTKILIERILAMSDKLVEQELDRTLREFAGRHRNISLIFLKHFKNHIPLLEHLGIEYQAFSDYRKLLLGAYSTMEYSIESAAMFNPSIVEDFDQTFLATGEKRVILSFRATGEGHLSSIVFRRGVINSSNELKLQKIRNHIDMPIIGQKMSYDKGRFVQKMREMGISENHSSAIMDPLQDRFEYDVFKTSVSKVLANGIGEEQRVALEEMTWLVDSYYDLSFSVDSDISERVIFPISETESKGIEDARFVRFKDQTEDDVIYATYTAYDGHTILPKLLSTTDFVNFRVMPLHGNAVQNKNFALFPEKINGQYAMLARVDGANNYIMFSDRNTLWNNPIKLQEPKYPWEFTQIGNCGSPIKTENGWLIITHGVGQMRRYCIGASLFDLDDPTKEIGRLERPLLSPLEHEREGYVPNVVYSCGAMIHNDSLILPYAVSDYSSSYATVDMAELLQGLKG